MDTSWALWFLLVPSVLQFPRSVGNGLDKETCRQMEARVKFLEEEKMRLERELEQLALKQSAWAWGDLPWSALHHWQVWALAGLLLLLLALWYVWRNRSLRREEQEEENDGPNEEEGRNVDGNEEAVGNEEEEGVRNEEDNEAGEERNAEDGNAQVVNNVGADEEGAVGNEAANVGNNNDVGNQADHPDPDDEMGRWVMEQIQWPMQDLEKGCKRTTSLLKKFLYYVRLVTSDSFYPVLKPAIGVGSAFEGWSPREQDVVYQVLIPMTPPRGHSFHVEMVRAGQRRERNFRIRVMQKCTCSRGRRRKKMLCFLHASEEELSNNQDPSLLDILCTDSYLDVQKTARWFRQLVKAIWPALPQSHNWHLVLLPSTRSCQFKVSNGRQSHRIEMLFGVQLGDSDIYVSSQPRPYYTPSTIWPESYAVAEVKFFRYIARRAPPDSLYLKCLQFFIMLQLGLGFSTYTTKTIVMHLLSMLPPSWWRRRHFVRRLLDISESLRTCVEVKCLNHFIVGNRELPPGITLPPHVFLSRIYNLFYDLTIDPVAHSQAISQHADLHRWLTRIINNEQ